MYSLFSQKNPTEIQDFFFQGVLVETSAHTFPLKKQFHMKYTKKHMQERAIKDRHRGLRSSSSHCHAKQEQVSFRAVCKMKIVCVSSATATMAQNLSSSACQCVRPSSVHGAGLASLTSAAGELIASSPLVPVLGLVAGLVTTGRVVTHLKTEIF